MERLLFARRVTVSFAEITEVERHPSEPQGFLPGGVSPRMRIHTDERRFDFVFHNGLDDWIDAVGERMRIWSTRERLVDAQS
jgi:hypothetical protein